MGILEALILGIVQGLTEFLPVSSSGHLEIGKAILNIRTTDNLLFSVLVHGATTLSTMVVFRKDIGNLFTGVTQFKYNASTRYVLMIVLSMVPVGIAGVFFKDEIESMFTTNLLLVGCALLVTAILLTITNFISSSKGQVTYGKALIIGLAQALAIIPGISRSGATISTALMLKVDRYEAARFSFLMVLIPIIGATLIELKEYIESPSLASGIEGSALIAGFLAAFVAGLLACSWMIRIVQKGKLIYFAVYCFIIGALSIVTSLI